MKAMDLMNTAIKKINKGDMVKSISAKDFEGEKSLSQKFFNSLNSPEEAKKIKELMFGKNKIELDKLATRYKDDVNKFIM